VTVPSLDDAVEVGRDDRRTLDLQEEAVDRGGPPARGRIRVDLEPHARRRAGLDPPAIGQLLDEHEPPAADVTVAASRQDEAVSIVADLDAQPPSVVIHGQDDRVGATVRPVANRVGDELTDQQSRRVDDVVVEDADELVDRAPGVGDRIGSDREASLDGEGSGSFGRRPTQRRAPGAIPGG
jgi:hypothetical protein